LGLSPARKGFAEASAAWPSHPPSACLADACALIVFHAFGAAGMSDAGRAAMQGGEVFVIAETVWEITRKAADGKLPPFAPFEDLGFPAFLRERGYKSLAVDWDIAARAATLPPHHRDPMDRMLIAASLATGLPIITNDAAFAAYGVTLVW
jgi:PIN domain nuclease of toxin-antitoxin system